MDGAGSAFAVASIRGWRRAEGRRLYLSVRRILITPDVGAVCHFPPGTSKWKKVEHRLFSSSRNWRGEPLRDYETVVRLIAGTTTAKGLKVTCRLDHRKYPVGRKITDVNLKPDKFHGEWNYTIQPSH